MCTEYQLNTDYDLGKGQKGHDRGRLRMDCNACAKLCADDGTDTDSECRGDQDMTEGEVADDTDER